MADVLNGLEGIQLLWINEDWQSEVKNKYLNSKQVVNYEGGITTIYEYSEDRPREFSIKVKLNTKENEYNFLSLFSSLRGKFSKFWIMEPTNTIKLLSHTTSTASSVDIEYNKFVSKGYERIYFLLDNGDFITARVIGSTENISANKVTIALSDPIGYNILKANVLRSGFLVLSRLGQDGVSLEFSAKCYAECTLDVKELVYETRNL